MKRKRGKCEGVLREQRGKENMRNNGWNQLLGEELVTLLECKQDERNFMDQGGIEWGKGPSHTQKENEGLNILNKEKSGIDPATSTKVH